MLGVSTCWRSRSISDGGLIVDELKSIGAQAVEIDYRLTPKMLEDALAGLSRNGMKALSMHAVCPAPEDKKIKAIAERASIAASGEAERVIGVADVIGTINLAARLGIPNVVIHCGKTPMEKITPLIQRRYDEGTLFTKEGWAFLNECRIERLRSRGNTFEQLLQSLDEIAEAAEKAGVNVGVENRYYMEEYPNFEELAVIFLKMSGSRIKYWHDTGHAQAQENLGLTSHEAHLAEFSPVMAGMHIHGVNGYTDHFPPPFAGVGSVDFAMVKKYIGAGVVKIMELRAEVAATEARAGLQWLEAQGF